MLRFVQVDGKEDQMLQSSIKLPVAPEDAQYAKWRVFVAEVRDRKPPHQSLSQEVADQARILAKMMDALDEQLKRVDAPTNMTLPLEGAILSMFGWLFLKGVAAPK